MEIQKISISGIPCIVWGSPSDKVYLYVHGKLSNKEVAEQFASIAAEKGYQTISFDLPGHGERIPEAERCDVWNGMRDLKIICGYVFEKWQYVSLYGCSLGAYFCLQSCSQYPFARCLLQSPIVDMEYLISQMMLWFGITPQRLQQEKEIDTPVDLMTWNYFNYVKEHPVSAWPIPTHILYAGKDGLQSIKEIETFAARFDCSVTVSPESEHAFMNESDATIVESWLRKWI